MWSWWDCMQWWNSSAALWDSSMPWVMFWPMFWPVVMIGLVIIALVLMVRGGRTETSTDPLLMALNWAASEVYGTPTKVDMGLACGPL